MRARGGRARSPGPRAEPAFAALHDLARELGADPVCLATLARAAARLSVLSLAPGVRAGGHGKTERHYRDLLIDGRSLTALAANDKIPPFGWLAGADRASADALLGKPSLPELRTDGAERAVVLVCGECGDLGCGALTLAVDVDPSGDVVTWRDLGTQTDFEAGFHPRPDLGPYRFARADYLAVIAELRAGSAR
ncbi:MAG: hypothetical protein U1F43_04820 [Myxococcota bacterium]